MSKTPLPTLYKTAVKCRCPKCGQGKLFAGFLDLAAGCDRCKLDYSFADSADGPAVFIIIIVGFITVGAALAVDVMFVIPYWLHLAIWLPLILVLSIGLLRPLKSLIVALQYRNGAREGRKADAE